MARRRNRTTHNAERRFTVRGVRRDPPDIRKLSRALIGLAQAEAERQAQAEREAHAEQERRAAAEVTPSDTPQTGGDGSE